MTNSELSNEFDVLYNNITSNQAPGLNEYEKSVFLTKAQDEIVKAYFDPKLNKPQEGFDGSERRQIDFSMLVKTEAMNEVTTSVVSLYPLGHSKFYAIPDKAMMFINESLAVSRNSSTVYLTVVPLSYTEYSRLMSKPFKRPVKNQAWRLLTNTKVNTTTTVTDYNTISAILAKKLSVDQSTVLTTIKDKTLSFDGGLLYVSGLPLKSDGTTTGTSMATFSDTEIVKIKSYIDRTINDVSSVAELVAGPVDNITSYTVRYISRPRAIILDTLEGVTLDGATDAQECELDPILHPEILQRAVELAKAAWTGDLTSQLTLGQSSETNMGVVTSSR